MHYCKHARTQSSIFGPYYLNYFISRNRISFLPNSNSRSDVLFWLTEIAKAMLATCASRFSILHSSVTVEIGFTSMQKFAYVSRLKNTATLHILRPSDPPKNTLASFRSFSYSENLPISLTVHNARLWKNREMESWWTDHGNPGVGRVEVVGDVSHFVEVNTGVHVACVGRRALLPGLGPQSSSSLHRVRVFSESQRSTRSLLIALKSHSLSRLFPHIKAHNHIKLSKGYVTIFSLNHHRRVEKIICALTGWSRITTETSVKKASKICKSVQLLTYEWYMLPISELH